VASLPAGPRVGRNLGAARPRGRARRGPPYGRGRGTAPAGSPLSSLLSFVLRYGRRSGPGGHDRRAAQEEKVCGVRPWPVGWRASAGAARTGGMGTDGMGTDG